MPKVKVARVSNSDLDFGLTTHFVREVESYPNEKGCPRGVALALGDVDELEGALGELAVHELVLIHVHGRDGRVQESFLLSLQLLEILAWRGWWWWWWCCEVACKLRHYTNPRRAPDEGKYLATLLCHC